MNIREKINRSTKRVYDLWRIPAMWMLSIGLGLIALLIPLLRDFHIESAMLASLAGCFWAGWSACDFSTPARSDTRRALQILGYCYLFGLPLLVYALFTGCFSFHGLGFWLLLPIPGIFFGYSTGRLLRKWNLPYRTWLTVLILLFVAVGVLLYEFFHLPQVYFFNHVWGYWPGPIYDESVQLTGSLFYFRFITLLWILLFWFIPEILADKQAKWIAGFSILALLFSYTRLAEAGIISPRNYLQEKLAGFKGTSHFELYFDQDLYSPDEIRLIAREHEFYLHQIARKLEVDTGVYSRQKIESYLYAHPWQKKKLVGAKFTSYVPVWLKQDQLHIARQQIDGSLKHELVHVIAKRFGNNLFHASWSAGLIEGLAVALAPGESKTSTIHQIVASEQPLPTTEEMEHALSPSGFYGGRSAVNYITSGSFAAYLLHKYPVEHFKNAYRSGRISSSYPVSFGDLVSGWKTFLDTVQVDSTDQRIARRMFSIPSLFEQECPHVRSAFAEAWDRYRFFMAKQDTAGALPHLNRALNLKPKNAFIKSEWTFRQLKTGNIKKVQAAASLQDSTIDLQLLYADTFALQKKWNTAHQFLYEAAARFSLNPDSLLEAALATRSNREQWNYYLDVTYRGILFPPDIFRKLFYRTKIRLIGKAIERESWDMFITYSEALSFLPADDIYFETYIKIIHYLGYRNQLDLARRWIRKVKELDLRPRYRQRLGQEKQWIKYLERHSFKSIGKNY